MVQTKKEQNSKNTVNDYYSKYAAIKELHNKGASKEVICVYKILTKKKRIFSNEIISIATSPEFADDCLLCASSDGIFRGLKALQEWGYCICHLQKGGYCWELLKS